MEKPAYKNMTNEQLLAAYNEVSTTKRKSKFSSKEDGIKACEAAWRAAHPVVRKSSRQDRKIKILAEDNPRREGTDAHQYFEDLKSSATVGDYLKKYEGKGKKAVRDARLWLYYNTKHGHAELVA